MNPVKTNTGTINSDTGNSNTENIVTGFERSQIEQSIVARFEWIAERFATFPAVTCEQQTLTYAALNRLVNQAAHQMLSLTAADESPTADESPIALLLQRDLHTLVALLASLKIGKGYVALDPTMPSARLAFLLADLQPRLIVTDHENIGLAAELAPANPLLFNLAELDASLPVHNPNLPTSPDALMSIFYTSGSTGRPKGVIRLQRAQLHRIWNETNIDGIGTNDRIAQLSWFGFAGAATDIFLALLNGALLCRYDIQTNGLSNLATWLQQHKITFMRIPVAHFRQLLDTLPAAMHFPHVRCIIPSGRLYRSDAARFWQHFPSTARLVSGMSLSEAGQVCRLDIGPETLMALDANAESHTDILPVGYTLPDKEVFLWDEEGNPVGYNQPGEIVVRSRYLSPGYWRNPELSRQVFLPDPTGGDQALCRSGDWGRMRADGCLEFLGRKDDMVKIRGFRVELGEVEVAMRTLADIHEVAVIAQERQAGEKYLVAYLVPSAYPAPTVTTLRAALAQKLPDAMIPASFVILDRLPRTPNGKLDRKALPLPADGRPTLSNAYVAPRTPLEAELAQLWSNVLGIRPIGIHDNFLDLGGHSLAATRLITHVLNTFQVTIPLRILLGSPTIAEMGTVITQYQATLIEQDTLAQLLTELETLPEEQAHAIVQAYADELPR